MSRLPLRTPENAPAEARPALEAAQQANGYLPNLLRVLANAPVALETYLTVSGINARASLSLPEREVVQITAAATHGCGFCVAGHTAIATRKAGMDAATVEALRAREPAPEPRLAAIGRFTAAVIATRGQVADADLAAFHEAGFTDQQALEVVLGVSLATLCNFANNLGQPPLNPQLEPYRWDGAAPVLVAG
ncbi:carboxymuconolactone decarboxylase family protein [Roseomonas sp. GC11]|uniref:carboxymuconolactone decarboxylase family protein n=1 Tax=Roseomonas sp. GC11 TaxID=2950546 RepID=UPI00210E864A|nr:carboxymuconolactone decarboxylase family protein [Roseomonas sp. GC11]MCQ4158672.1 carboxymuconolactone decarboxylase family protein [Roseomonas sp. GC11]